MTPPATGSPITAMWAWDNPVDPALDPHGRGYAPASAERLAAFARAGALREVHLLAPSAAADGPVAAWLRETVTALHDAGVSVSAVTGVRGATAGWATTATALAPFDRLQVAVVPWSPPDGSPGQGSTAAGTGAAVADALTVVRTAAPGVPVDACVPWWFAEVAADDGGTLLRPVVAAADRVALAAPGRCAEGPDGVLERASPAVAVLVAAGRPFSVGVQADTPEVAGGADVTFWDEGPVALIRECAVVAGALAAVPGFEGVTVKSHRAWRRLLGV